MKKAYIVIVHLLFTTFLKAQNVEAVIKIDKLLSNNMVQLNIKLLASHEILIMFNHDIFCPVDSSTNFFKSKEILHGKRVNDLSTNDFLIENEAGELKWYSLIANKKRILNKPNIDTTCSSNSIEPVLLKSNEEFTLSKDFFSDDLKIKSSDSNIRFHFILNINDENYIVTSNWIKI